MPVVGQVGGLARPGSDDDSVPADTMHQVWCVASTNTGRTVETGWNGGWEGEWDVDRAQGAAGART